MLRPQRQQQRVLGRRGLQLEVELPAEALAQRESPGAVDARAERRMQDELHAAGLVEEALQHERVLRRQHAEGGARGGKVVDDLLRGGGGDAVLRHPERERGTWRVGWRASRATRSLATLGMTLVVRL